MRAVGVQTHSWASCFLLAGSEQLCIQCACLSGRISSSPLFVPCFVPLVSLVEKASDSDSSSAICSSYTARVGGV